MIIVDQDKAKIVNFDNLTQIYLTDNEDKSSWFIRFETVGGLYDDLGEYKTEERVKEILQEIIKKYYKENWQFDVGMDICHRQEIYEMPKE